MVGLRNRTFTLILNSHVPTLMTLKVVIDCNLLESRPVQTFRPLLQRKFNVLIRKTCLWFLLTVQLAEFGDQLLLAEQSILVVLSFEEVALSLVARDEL